MFVKNMFFVFFCFFLPRASKKWPRGQRVNLAWKHICTESYLLISLRRKINQQMPERLGRSILIGLNHILGVARVHLFG